MRYSDHTSLYRLPLHLNESDDFGSWEKLMNNDVLYAKSNLRNVPSDVVETLLEYETDMAANDVVGSTSDFRLCNGELHSLLGRRDIHHT